MTATKITALDTGKTLATIDVLCLMDLKKTLDGKRYHILEVTPTDLDKSRSVTCSPEVFEGISEALGQKETLLMGYTTLKPEATWKITGVVMDRNNQPLPGLRILAYDKDTLTKDDFLGCDFTDENGAFQVGYEEEDFKGKKRLIDFEGNPDIYLEITDIPTDRTKRTVVRDESDKEEYFELKISFDSDCMVLRPIVGRYFIEEDMLKTEIDEIWSKATQEPNQPDHQFYLGICLIEMMKTDLRKSEWVLGDVRSDDGSLALAAIECFEKVIELDPERAEEAQHYLSYTKELQDLAL
jgi:hypothetical protein